MVKVKVGEKLSMLQVIDFLDREYQVCVRYNLRELRDGLALSLEHMRSVVNSGLTFIDKKDLVYLFDVYINQSKLWAYNSELAGLVHASISVQNMKGIKG